MTQYPYSYDELLFRLHNDKNEDEIYSKVNLPPIKISRKNRASIFSNFGILAEKLNRDKEHISNYFKAETKLVNTTNQHNQLIIQGNINESKCESIMKKYINEFVCCRQCKGLNTIILKEHGLTFIQCNQCLAKTSLGKL